MTASTNNARARLRRWLVRWIGRGLIVAGVWTALGLLGERITEWSREVALAWAAAVGTLCLALLRLCWRRVEAPIVRVPVRYPLMPRNEAERPRLQFGVRSLLVAMTLVAVVTAMVRRDGLPLVYAIATLGAAFVVCGLVAWLVSRLPTYVGATSFLALCLFVPIILLGVYRAAPRAVGSLADLMEPRGPPWHPMNAVPLSMLAAGCVLVGVAVGWAMSAAEQRA